MPKTAYKVLKRDGGTLVSPWIDAVRVEYQPGRWTDRPEGWGPLSVYKSPETALRKAEAGAKTQALEVWEVEYRPSPEKVLYAHDLVRLDYGFYGLDSDPVDAHSDTAEAIRLVRRIQIVGPQYIQKDGRWVRR